MRPKSIKGAFGVIFLFIGVAFLLMGAGLRLHILKPDHTEGNPAFWFPIIGGSMFLIGFVLFLWGYLWVRRQKNLQREGILVEGKITCIRHLIYLKFNRKRPFRIYFTYEWEGFSYRGKSTLLWHKPKQQAGDGIFLLIDENKPRQVAIKEETPKF